MNDLMPPDRRPMPGDRSQTMRTFLQDEAEPVRPQRRRSVPVLVAAAVAVIAVGGYVTASQLGDEGSTEQQLPAGQPSGQDPTIEPTVEPTKDPNQKGPEQGGVPHGDPSLNQLTKGTGPADAEQRCVDAIEAASHDVPSDVTARVVNESAEMTTVVISNGEFTRTCNVEPDAAASPKPGSQPPVKNPPNLTENQLLFNFARNSTLDYDLGRGTYAWAGGPAPAGVESITYVFPDGGEADAVVEDGFWAMQYLTKGDIGWREKVHVVLRGQDGTEVVKLDTSWAGCHQVSHGC